MSSDGGDNDLDALLDDAMDTIDKQDEQVERDRAAREIAAREVLEKTSEGLEAQDSDMQQALGTLLGILGRGPEFFQNADDKELDGLSQQLMGITERFEQKSDAGSSDKGTFAECRSMLERMKTGTDLSPEEVATMETDFQSMREKLKGAMSDLGGEADVAAAAAAAERMSAPSGAAEREAEGGASSSSAETPEQRQAAEDAKLLEMFGNMMQPDVMREPFLRLRDGLKVYVTSDRAKSVSASEMDRFQGQLRCATAIGDMIEKENLCGLLSAAAGRDAVAMAENKDSKASAADQPQPEEGRDKIESLMNRFSELVSELQTYGEPPKDLFDGES